jgi:hypothetical protein
MTDARGPDWTDLLGDLLPIVITVVIGVLAITRRGIEALFKRRSEAARTSPRPPLNQEVRQFLEMLERDTGRRVGEPATEEEESTDAPPALDETPAPPIVTLPTFAPPPPAPPIRVVGIAPALAVARPIHVERARRPPRTPALGARPDLRQAFVWSEILGPPLALREPIA